MSAKALSHAESVLALAAATAAFVADRVRADAEHHAGTELAGETAVFVYAAVRSFFEGPGRMLLGVGPPFTASRSS